MQAGRDLLALFALGLLLYLPATRQAMSLRDVPERAPALRINAQQKQQQHSRLRLRGGVFTPDELQEMYTTEQHANQPDQDFNITADVVEDWSKEKQEAFERMCDEELERHWRHQREQRAADIAAGWRGSRHVAEDEYCCPNVDGRIYKFKYAPDKHSGSGPWNEEFSMPEPVDQVDPDALPDIVAALDRRDRTTIAEGRQVRAEAEQQLATLEALAWYNGTKRAEFEQGKFLWWRNLPPWARPEHRKGAAKNASADREGGRDDAREARRE